jgi:hypothetical protein
MGGWLGFVVASCLGSNIDPPIIRPLAVTVGDVVGWPFTGHGQGGESSGVITFSCDLNDGIIVRINGAR